MYSLPTTTTLAVFTMTSAASIAPTRPLVSIIPRASNGTSRTLTDCGQWQYWLSLDQPWPTLTPAHKGLSRAKLVWPNRYRVGELMDTQSGRILLGALDRIVYSSANYWIAMLSDLAAALAFLALGLN